jgi:hypothetical protein
MFDACYVLENCMNGRIQSVPLMKYAAYTFSEITELLRHSKLHDAVVTRAFFGLCIAGQKRQG